MPNGSEKNNHQFNFEKKTTFYLLKNYALLPIQFSEHKQIITQLEQKNTFRVKKKFSYVIEDYNITLLRSQSA